MSSKTVTPYLRQSTGQEGETAQTSLSIEDQYAQIAAWAVREGYVLNEPVIDHDEKGWDDARPGLNLLRQLSGNDTIIAISKWDRLARDIVIQEQFVRAAEKAGVAVVSVTEPSDPMGRALLGVFSEHFRRQLSERCRAVTRTRAARGAHIGVTPYGYVAVPNPQGPRPPTVLSVDPEAAEQVRQMYAERIAGSSLREIRDRHPSIRNATRVGYILKNRAYLGEVTVTGETVATAAHPAIIEPHTFELVQRTFTTGQRTKGHHARSWLAGLVDHGCGARMYEGFPVLHGTTFAQFRCRDSRGASITKRVCYAYPVSIGARKLEAAVLRCLQADLASIPDAATVYAHEVARAGGTDADSERATITRQIAKLDERFARADALYLSGDRDRAWLREQEAHIGAERARLTLRLDALSVIPEHDALTALERGLRGIGDILAGAGPSGRREAVLTLGRVIVDRGVVSIRYHEAFAGFFDAPHEEHVGKLTRHQRVA